MTIWYWPRWYKVCVNLEDFNNICNPCMWYSSMTWCYKIAVQYPSFKNTNPPRMFLCAYLPCSLWGKSWTTRQSSIDLNDTIFQRFRMQSILDIALSYDSQMADNLDGGLTKHVVFLIWQSLAWGYYDGITWQSKRRYNYLDIFKCTLPTLLQSKCKLSNIQRWKNYSHKKIGKLDYYIVTIQCTLASNVANYTSRIRHGIYQVLLNVGYCKKS